MDKPVYITISEIARHLDIHPNNIASTIQPWKDDPEEPYPEPDAYHVVKDGYLTQLWLPRRLPEWIAWNDRRKILGRQRQGQRGRQSRAPRPQLPG